MSTGNEAPRTLSPVTRACALALGAALAAPALEAQAQLRVTPAAVVPGNAVQFTLRAGAQLPFATWLDAEADARALPSEVLRLALTPVATPLLLGVTDAQGVASTSLTTPTSAALVGQSAYFQSFVVDGSAPNGRFRASDGESLSFFVARRAHVERFDDPRADGFVGDFVDVRDGRLLGVPVRARRVVTADSSKGMQFGQPLVGELDGAGAHQQVVVRAVDLKATGDEELITAIRMRPFGNFTAGRLPLFAMDLAHSTVAPDFSVDAFSGLPRFPASGLSLTYTNNTKLGTNATRVYFGPFLFSPQQITPSGYLPYPRFTRSFRYNGRDSLLIDFRTAPSQQVVSLGHRVWLPVQSSPRPDARIFRTNFDPLRNPMRDAARGDNTLFEYEIDLVDVTSIVESPWRDSGVSQPRYRAPVLARVTPTGSSIEIEWRDAQNAQGAGAGAWRQDVTTLTQRFFQMRITLRGTPDGARPWLEALTLPID